MNKIEKFIYKIIACCLAFSCLLTVTAFAGVSSEGNREIVSQKQILLEDGTTATQTITRIQHPTVPFALYERVTYEETTKMSNFSVTLTGTFSYSKVDKKVSCVSKYGSTDGINVKINSVTDTGSGRTCTVKMSFTYNNLGTPMTKSVSMKCDYNGNI